MKTSINLDPLARSTPARQRLGQWVRSEEAHNAILAAVDAVEYSVSLLNMEREAKREKLRQPVTL